MQSIERLTPEQEQQMIAFREKWRSIGLATGPADLEKVRPIINSFYAKIGKDAPYLWRCSSPLMAQLVMNYLNANLRDNLSDNLFANLRDNLSDNLFANLRANLSVNLRANLFANLRANLSDNLSDNLRDNLRVNLRDNLRDNLSVNLRANLSVNLRDNLRANLRDNLLANLSDNLRDNLLANLLANLRHFDTWMWGSLDAYWIAFYLYPHANLRPMHTAEQMEILNGWATIAEGAFWWYAFDGVCFICDRPTEIHFDDRNFLHNESGPSVAFSDGWSLWNIHGVAVPQQVVMHPELITANQIETERNAEVRRVMLERMGADKFMMQAKPTVKHEDADRGGMRRLLVIAIPDDEPVVMLSVICPSTHGNYMLRVPPTMQTCHQAAAWIAGYDNPDDYAPIHES